MRISKDDLIEVHVVNKTGMVIVPRVEDRGFNSIASVISFAREKVPSSEPKRGIQYRINNKTRRQFSSYNNSGNKVF